MKYGEGIGGALAKAELSVVDSTSGHPLFLSGDIITTKLFGNQTGGDSTVSEVIVLPQGGPPLHRHMQLETLYVLEGEVEFTGARRDKFCSFKGTAGSLFHVPGCVPHTYFNATEKPARLLAFNGPAGLERYFAEAGRTVADLGEAQCMVIDREQVKFAGLHHGVEPIDQQLFDSREGYRASGVHFAGPENYRQDGYEFLSYLVYFLARSGNTESALTVMEINQLGGATAPPHSHPQGVVFYVLEGELEFRAEFRGKRSDFTAARGSTLHIPRHVRHSFTSIGDGPTRLLAFFSPAGLESFVEELGLRVGGSQAFYGRSHVEPVQAEWDQVTEVGSRHGISVTIGAVDD